MLGITGGIPGAGMAFVLIGAEKIVINGQALETISHVPKNAT
jgi:hypothetical protein